MFIGGSYSRGTLISGAGDVDLFAVIAHTDVTWGQQWKSSETVLNRFRAELVARYPMTTVRRDLQAVVVAFSVGPCVDVVPAVFDRMAGNRPQYFIPDGKGDWMPTSPEQHNVYISNADARSKSKLKRVTQLVKFWRDCCSTRFALSSFHIEMLLASTEICTGVKTYAACVNQVLRTLADRECRALQDPLGISGLIPAVKTHSQQEDALASVRYARGHANDACVADYSGDSQEAWRQWNIVFKGNFPR